MPLNYVAALSVVVLTVGLSLGRPRIGPVRIHHSGAALIGAALTVLLGIASPHILIVAVKLLAAPVVTIVSLMIITQVAERTGLFEILGAAIERRAGGSGRRLFTYIFFTGTLVGTVFTNDAAVLILTPIVCTLVERVGGTTWKPENKLPYYFAVLYVANLVGALVIANPINLVVAGLMNIGFVEFAVWMALPAVVSILISFAGIWFFFRRSIPSGFVPGAQARQADDGKFARISCAIIVALTLVGFFTETITGIPTWMVALAGALASMLMHRGLSGKELGPVVRGVSWDVIIFMGGMFVVGLGLREAGVTHLLGGFIEQLSGGSASIMRMSTGLLAGTCSAIINNHPTADLMAFTIQGLTIPHADKKLLAFAALIGGDLGPKMLPIGSLAALIWFRLLKDRGVNVPYSLYIRVGVPVTLIALVASLLAVELQHWIATTMQLMGPAGP